MLTNVVKTINHTIVNCLYSTAQSIALNCETVLQHPEVTHSSNSCIVVVAVANQPPVCMLLCFVLLARAFLYFFFYVCCGNDDDTAADDDDDHDDMKPTKTATTKLSFSSRE